MPTIFCDCEECNYLEQFSIDHKFNRLYKKDKEIYEAFLDCGFPDIVALNIIKQKNTLKSCDYCQYTKVKLCEEHYNRALKYGKNYRGQNGKAMCDKCCWNELS